MPSVKHVVLLRFKWDVREADIADAFDRLAELKNLIPGLTDFVHGPNTSAEGLSEDLTHGFVMTFVDAAARDAYLPHPEHERVKRALLPKVERVLVFDFEV